MDDTPIPELVRLAAPRALTARERGLIDFLLASPYGDEELRSQAASAEVIGVCSCGCASVLLGVDPAAPASQPGDWAPCGPHDLTAYQVTSRRLGAQVTLHVAEGYLNELEIWAGRYGVRARIDPLKLKRVQDIDWGRADDEDS